MTMLLAEEAGADAIMIRSSWLGIHVAGFLPDYLFYPGRPGAARQDAAAVLRQGARRAARSG